MIGRNRHPDNKPAQKKRGWRRFFVFLFALAGAIWLGGFLSFAFHVDQLRPNQSVPKADGIVVWTGKGGGRLETAGALLNQGRGERLLVSGVNAAIDIDAVRPLLGIDVESVNCCVDLDYAAVDTIGNARETAAWAKALDYDHIILVTSAYHMPRAKVEIGAVAGRIRITPVPVQRTDTRPWYRDEARAKRLFGEYTKLLLAFARGRDKDIKAPILAEPEKTAAG